MKDEQETRVDLRKGVRPKRSCEWPDCNNKNRGGYQAYCPKHSKVNAELGLPVRYHADKPAKKMRYHNRTTGYWLLRRPGHPLATKAGYVYEHRAVAFEKYGLGTQTCHWCHKQIEWAQVDVDHLDWDRGNNCSENVVTSCEACNVLRTCPRTKPTPAKPMSKLMSLALAHRD